MRWSKHITWGANHGERISTYKTICKRNDTKMNIDKEWCDHRPRTYFIGFPQWAFGDLASLCVMRFIIGFK